MLESTMFHGHHFGQECNPLCGMKKMVPGRITHFMIRKLPLLKSAPWTILSTRRLQMIGCLGYSYAEGVWAYPFKTQAFALFALEHALKREAQS